jgi:beta-glucosidase
MMSETPLYRRSGAPLARRVEDLLARMSLEEKIVEVCAIWEVKGTLMGPDGLPDAARLAQRFPHGVGHVARPADARGEAAYSPVAGCGPAATVARVNAFQRHALSTRLGIPVLCHEEGLHGYAAPGATSFPQAMALASSFDTELVRAVNAVTAREMRARGVVLALTPVLDIARDPRWGRVEETFGEDPHLVAEMGLAAVRGLQGDLAPDQPLPPDKVFATLKHLAGHGQPEGGVNVGPAPLAERELREQFLPPFERAVREAGASVVMASYNEIGGLPSHANRWLLADVLRGEWGFQGAVVGDYFAVEQLASLHRVAAGPAEAAARALAAGVDADLPNGEAYAHLAAEVRAGRVPMTQLDAAVRRMLALKFRAGLFEQPFADAKAAEAATHDASAQALALRAAERSVVLLKNDGTLPLALPVPGRGRRPVWAVIGPNAAEARLGSYSGTPPQALSLLDGLRQVAGHAVDLRHAQGVHLTEGDDEWADEVRLTPPDANRALIEAAVDVATAADLVVLAVGDDLRTSREAWAADHLGDRSGLGLVGEQRLLFERLVALGKPVVVVLINGRPVSEPLLAERAHAIVEAWFPGEMGGLALARVLTGAVNPGAKLPLTVPRHVGQLPLFYNHKPSARRGYLFDDITPLYPFGHGLSYTRFEFGPPRLSSPVMPVDGAVTVSVDVTNVGERTGDEVVQLYVRDCVASVAQPVKALKAFERVTLAPGERRTVHLVLRAAALALWNEQMQRVVEPGEFEVMVGPDSVALQSVRLSVHR